MNTISPSRTSVTLGISAVLTVGAALISGTWQVTTYLAEQREALRRSEAEIAALQAQIEQVREQMWTIHDMNTWSGRARWENRNVPVLIPEPRDWRDWRNRITDRNDPARSW